MFLSRDSRVFVIIVNYLHALDTVRCIASLRRSRDRNLHPVVVDNGSGPGEAERLRTHLGPAIPILELADNSGYAAGNNHGIRYSLERGADYVWILNPDTEAEPDALTMLMSTMRRHPDAGFVGSLNVDAGVEPPEIHFAGGRIDWDRGAITTSMAMGSRLDKFKVRQPYPVDYVAGASMLIRRQVFADAGLLPEHYFLYFEETDFQVRASAHGWRSYLSPLARVWHHRRSAGDLPTPYYIYYYIRGRLLFAQAHTSHSVETIEAGLEPFIAGWRTRVTSRAPHWLNTYEQLVSWALADGRAGVSGRRAEIETIEQAAV